MNSENIFYAILLALLREPLDAMRFALGAFMVIFCLFKSTPSADDLVLFTAEYKNLSKVQDCSRKCTTEVVITLGENFRRFRNDAVKESNIDRLGELGSTISIYVEKIRTVPLSKAGQAEKSWGLTVNGNEIERLDKSLLEEKFWLYFVLPLIGVFLMAITFPYRVFRDKKS